MQKHVTRVAEGSVAGEAWEDMYGAVRKAMATIGMITLRVPCVEERVDSGTGSRAAGGEERWSSLLCGDAARLSKRALICAAC